MWYAIVSSCNKVPVTVVANAKDADSLLKYLRKKINAAIEEFDGSSKKTDPDSFDDILFVEGSDWMDIEDNDEYPEPFVEVIKRFAPDEINMATAEIPEHIFNCLAPSLEDSGCFYKLHIIASYDDVDDIKSLVAEIEDSVV